MCLVVLSYRKWRGYSLVIAANRDEFFLRPAAKAQFWDDLPHLLAGRDLTSFGTWLGVTKQGKVSFITNRRDLRETKIASPISRGKLVSEYLNSEVSPEEYLGSLHEIESSYEGFNLFLLDQLSAYYLSNRGGGRYQVDSGFHTLSNAFWNTKWPKTDLVLSEFLSIAERYKIQGGNLPVESLFTMLNDRRVAEDSYLPDTGLGKERERLLSSVRISLPGYGTRVSTVLAINENGECEFWEKTFEEPFSDSGEVSYFKFNLEG